MKSTIKIAAVSTMLLGASQAAVTISGTVGTSFKGDNGVTNIPVGSLIMVIIDADDNGFLALSDEGAVAPSLVGITADPGVQLSNASITNGGFFGGDKIINLTAVSTAGVIPTLMNNVSIAGYTSKDFAVVWFQKSAATLGVEGLSGQSYGILSGADWTLPASDSGTFTMSATDAVPADNYYSVSVTMTSAQMGTTGFYTGTGTAGDGIADIKTANLTIIPEPSTALFGAFGALALLRRRRVAQR